MFVQLTVDTSLSWPPTSGVPHLKMGMSAEGVSDEGVERDPEGVKVEVDDSRI